MHGDGDALPAQAAADLRLLVALIAARQALECARRCGRPAWDFAMGIDELRAAGLCDTSLRWCVCRGWLEHGHEMTRLGDPRRSFRSGGGLHLSRRSCFVLSPAGVELVERLRAPLADAARNETALWRSEAPQAIEQRPHWDAARHELRLRGLLVKQYKLPSPNQERILAAFEEDGWPPRIDDPLPPRPEIEPNRRLHDAIKALNRCQKHRLLRFKGDGTSEGVIWELAARTGSNGGAGGDDRLPSGAVAPLLARSP
jgi:hypothetical protein